MKLAAPWARALFPAEDTPLLPHVCEEGDRAEPVCYAPVLPTLLLESHDIPSEGWAARHYGRCLAQISLLLAALLRGDPLVLRVHNAAKGGPPGPLRPPKGGASALCSAEDAEELQKRFPLTPTAELFGASFSAADRQRLVRRSAAGGFYSFGAYRVEREPRKPDILRVIELPRGVTTEAYVKAMKKLKDRDPRIAAIRDESGGWAVDVEFTLAPGALDALKAEAKAAASGADAFEQFFRLAAPLNEHLNFFAPEGHVVEFHGDAHAVFFWWAAKRQAAYVQRIRRSLALAGLKQEFEAAVARFLETGRPVLDLASEEEAVAQLEADGYPRFNARLLASPGFTPTEDLARLIRAGPECDFDYLLARTARDFVRGSRKSREAEAAAAEHLAAAQKQLEESPFPGASQWMVEAQAALNAVEKGRQTGWKF